MAEPVLKLADRDDRYRDDDYPKTYGRITLFSWGWQVKLPFHWWLVYADDADGRYLYISDNGTPPDHESVRGRFLWRGLDARRF